jgi:hypothetical protein
MRNIAATGYHQNNLKKIVESLQNSLKKDMADSKNMPVPMV